MIPQQTIERIRSAANIVDVVSEYVTLKRAGSSFRGLCPFHDDTTPSFSVSPSRGLCKCFACGEGGDVVHFIMKKEQLGYYDALRFLAKRYGIEIEERELTDEERRSQNERESLYAVNEWACNYFSDTLKNNEEGRTIGMAYFRSRGFRDDIIEKFRLGFSTSSFDAMTNAALKAGYKEEYLVETGICGKSDKGKTYDKYHGRVIFPWFSVSGKVVGFGGRKLDAATKGVQQKYINSPESPIYHKANELYGLFQAKQAISKEQNVYMVEGYTDVISMHQCGIFNVVANSGTALSEAQISLLHRFTNNITLLYDGDAAGQKAALRGTDMLLARGMRVKILLLPDNDDPDSFARKHNATEFCEYVNSHQVDFITFKTNLLIQQAANDPDKMADLISSILQSIAVIPDEIQRSVYIHKCSEMLKKDENMLLRNVSKIRKQNWEQKQREKQLAEDRKNALMNGGGTTTDGPEGETNGGAATNDGTTTGEEPVPAPKTPQPADDPFATLAPELRRYAKIERLIMQVLVRYGEHNIMIADYQGRTSEVSLIDYVGQNMHNDELEFRVPIYREMFAQLSTTPRDANFRAANIFLNSPREDFSREAIALLTDRYQLFQKQEKKPGAGYDQPSADDTDTARTPDSDSEPFDAKRIAEQIDRLMLEYKNLIITIEMENLLKLMADPAVLNDANRYMSLLQQQMVLTNMKKMIAEQLGIRVMG